MLADVFDKSNVVSKREFWDLMVIYPHLGSVKRIAVQRVGLLILSFRKRWSEAKGCPESIFWILKQVQDDSSG